ncbi:MAG: amino acid ABC transporter permease [Clostridiales bacterium]|nr:amino acid ABC transporter permease [Clostridiales bacterium]
MGAWLQRVQSQFILNFIEKDRWKYLVNGLGTTLRITIGALIIGAILGAVIAIVRATWDKNRETLRPGFGRSLLEVVNGICKLYLTVIRGTPVVVQLMIMYYIIFASSKNGVAVATLAFGLNSAAYVAEIIRSGIMSIDNGQFEAGRSLGFNYVQTMWHIILPQSFKNVLPALANELITLLKETSVAGYVAVVDLTKGGDIIRGVTYSPFMPLIFVALIYLIIVVVLTKLVGILERRLRNSDH